MSFAVDLVETPTEGLHQKGMRLSFLLVAKMPKLSCEVLLTRKSGISRVTTCLENVEMSGNLTAVREMSVILLKVREMSGKSCLKLFIISCIFACIQVFSRSLFCVKN